MNETFEIIINDNGVIEEIPLYNEPVGYDSVDFNLQQESGRYGRDISFAGGEIELEFTPMAHPEVFDKIVEQFEKHGFEADVVIRIVIGNREFKGNLDFLTADYNGHDSFKCMMLQESKSTILKRRSDLPVDLFSDKDLDKNDSLPVETENVFIRGVETAVSSKWDNPDGENSFLLSIRNNIVPMPLQYLQETAYINASNRFEGDIKSSLGWMDKIKNQKKVIISDYDGGWYNPVFSPQLVNAQTDLNNVLVSVDFDESYFEIVSSYNFKSVVKFIVRVGDDFFNPREEYTLQNFERTNGGNNESVSQYFVNQDITIPKVLKDENIWAFFFIDVRKNISSYENFKCDLVLHHKDVKIEIKALEQNFDLLTSGVKLYDAVSKVIRDTCGLPLSFKLAEVGALKNSYLFTGDMIRGIKSFKLSFDDIVDWFPELNLDYEITKEESVFIGRYEDFYTNNEIDVFEDVAFDTFKYSENELYAINKFTYEYEKYQSQKEDTENYTKNIIHGKAEYHINNKQVGESKEVKVSWVRDPFMLKEMIDKAFRESEKTSTNEDNTVYIIDTTNMSGTDFNIRKSAMLFHERYDGTGEVLILKNDGSFRFDLLGIRPGSQFTIHNTQNGEQTYQVGFVYPNYIELFSDVPVFSLGEEFTEFTYSLTYGSNNTPVVTKKAKYIKRKTEGLVSPETFANYDFSVKHNIDRYWRTWISTCVKNSINPELLKYDNNPDYKEYAWTMTFPSVPVVSHHEGADINVSNVTPILDTKIAETKIIMPFERYIRISDLLRSGERGFIRTFDPKNRPIYIYPQSMTARYKASGLKEVDVKGELKNISESVNVSRNRSGAYIVGFYTFQRLNYSVVNEDTVQFKDMNDMPILKLYKYDKVQVNSVSYKSIAELEDAFDKL